MTGRSTQMIGVMLLLAAMTLVPFVDAVAKQLSGAYSPFFVSFARYFSAGIVAVLIAAARGRPIRVPRGDRLGQVARTALLMGAMTSLIFALSLVRMADVLGAFFLAPVVSTVLAGLFLKERMSAAKVLGVGAGFVGAMMIVRPGASMEPGLALALLAGVLFGCYLAATRRAADQGDDLSTLAVQSLLGSAMLAPFAFWSGPPAIDWTVAGAVALMGALSAACHFLTINAFRFADASTLSPFMYFNLVTATAVGYVLFSETPAAITVAGMAVIAAGGLIIGLPGGLLILPASAVGKVYDAVIGLRRGKRDQAEDPAVAM